jgi:hypothetical protein
MAITQKNLVLNLLISFAAIAVAIPFFWLFRGFAWWIVLSFLIYWSLAAALVAFAWKKWARERPQMDADGMRNDRPFLIGQILGTLSCCAPLFFFVPLAGSWDLLRGFGVIFSVGAAVSALIILPFGSQTAKRLTIVGCVMNVAFYGFCAIYALSISGGWLLD